LSKRSSEPGRVAVVSPHLDDGVFTCGALLARRPGSAVITVFAGAPAVAGPVTAWDRAAGFRDGDDVIGARRAEDRAALTLLEATPVWLDFCDAQYGPPPKLPAIADALEQALDTTGVSAVVIPLGLFHSDHRLAHDAAIEVRRRRHHLAWVAGEDAIYRRLPGLVDEAVARLQALGMTPRRIDGNGIAGAGAAAPAAHERKRVAVACYRSQLRALAAPGMPGTGDIDAPERYWSLG
jgi:LmbE family N-acetylglucosaminyl deacetylase